MATGVVIIASVWQSGVKPMIQGKSLGFPHQPQSVVDCAGFLTGRAALYKFPVQNTGAITPSFSQSH
jgi:hypothetical protein